MIKYFEMIFILYLKIVIELKQTVAINLNRYHMKSQLSKLFLSIFIIFIIQNVQAQSEEKVKQVKNTVYLELFGSAGAVYNITYDRIILSSGQNNLSAAIGLQYFPLGVTEEENHNIYSISPQINYFTGKIHRFELGLGFAYDFYEGGFVFPLRIGYRYQKNEGGMFYKVGFTPLYSNDLFWHTTILPWGGIAVGWSF